MATSKRHDGRIIHIPITDGNEGVWSQSAEDEPKIPLDAETPNSEAAAEDEPTIPLDAVKEHNDDAALVEPTTDAEPKAASEDEPTIPLDADSEAATEELPTKKEAAAEDELTIPLDVETENSEAATEDQPVNSSA